MKIGKITGFQAYRIMKNCHTMLDLKSTKEKVGHNLYDVTIYKATGNEKRILSWLKY